MRTLSRHNINLEDEVTRLEAELRLYKELKLTRIERKINELLDALDDPATPQTKGQRLRERLGIIAATVALTAIAQTKVDIPIHFQQPTKQEQVSPKFSPSSAPSLDKVQSTTAPSISKPAAKPETKPESYSLEKLMKAIATQESGGRSDLINSDSGASGKWQVMPANIPGWSRAALGREVSHSEFVSSPEIQQAVVKHRLNSYLKQESTPGRSEEETIRRVASLWYSGRSHLWNDTRPQFSNGRQYPSIASYTRSVWRHYIDAPNRGRFAQAKAIIGTWGEEFQQDAAKGDTIAGFELTSPKGMRTHPVTGQEKMHNGADLATPVGTPLYAIADGVIEYGHNSIAGLYGSFSSPELPNLEFKLVHLSKGLAEPGDKRQVKRGDVIGWTGGAKGCPNAGRSTGAHLHLGIRASDGEREWLRVRRGWLHWFITGKKPS